MKYLSVAFSPIVVVLGLGFMLLSLTPAIVHCGNSVVDRVWQPKLLCEQTTCDFGRIQATDKPNHTFVIENQGNRDLLIKSVAPGCGSCGRHGEDARAEHRDDAAIDCRHGRVA